MKKLRLILGDQLNTNHSWFQEKNPDTIYCLFEMRQETDYVQHHIQKVVGFFSAMRSFSLELAEKNYKVIYYKINDQRNKQDLVKNLLQIIQEEEIVQFEYLSPDEYRLDKQLTEFCKAISIKNTVFDTEHFYTDRSELKNFYEGKKLYVMENFYRYMRKKHHVLMEGSKPEGGEWNYDKSNRKKWKKETLIPPYKIFLKDVSELVNEIKIADIQTIGNINTKNFEYPTTRNEVLNQLEYFCSHLLIYFGDYQDAMHTDEVNLYHSRISFAMNIKLISPKEVIEKVLETYRHFKNEIHISQVEGFIRQIIGWREYMRGMYWALMPSYKELNVLNNQNKLPNFFWTGKTKMNCLKNTINNSLDNAYAHHIQRLMITGNFALLMQIHPDEVDAWYLGIYNDAIEWVQLTNTRGMSQFADGGKIATKPYVSSANYIDKMSNYCGSCYYNKKEKTTPKACPFNSLYWNFLDDKKQYFYKNNRMGMMLRLLEKISPADLADVKERAYKIIANPDAF